MKIDHYCLECGSSVESNVCDYCGSDKIDFMEIPEEEVESK